MSSVGGYSNPLCCLPYVDVITATNVWKKNKLPNTAGKKDEEEMAGPVCACESKRCIFVCLQNKLTIT